MRKKHLSYQTGKYGMQNPLCGTTTSMLKVVFIGDFISNIKKLIPKELIASLMHFMKC